MIKRGLLLAVATAAAIGLAGCTGDREPSEAAGAKVLRNLLSKEGLAVKVTSFKTLKARGVKTQGAEAFEIWYAAEFEFPEPFEASCVNEVKRGRCTYLGLIDDKSFKKGEMHASEGTLHFVRSDKGWVGEDQNVY
jgi:hypothetical protein